MDPASAAPEAGSAGIPAAPRTPASSLPFAGRSQIAAPPPAGSSPLHTPRAAPARTVPRLSSLRPLPILAEDLLLPDFCSGPAGLSGRSMRDYLSGALMSTRNERNERSASCSRPSIFSKRDGRPTLFSRLEKNNDDLRNRKKVVRSRLSLSAMLYQPRQLTDNPSRAVHAAPNSRSYETRGAASSRSTQASPCTR